ncbi:MAG: hypothetical protein ACTSYC_10430 [Promethearchaeota archaeon]
MIHRNGGMTPPSLICARTAIFVFLHADKTLLEYYGIKGREWNLPYPIKE